MPTSPDLPISEPGEPSNRVRWVLLVAFLGLLGLIVAYGFKASSTLRDMHQREQEARRAVAEREQALSNLYVSIEIYNQGIQRYVGYPAEKSDPQIRRQLDRLTAEIGSRLDGYPDRRDPQEAAVLEAILQLFQRHRQLYESLLTAGDAPRTGVQELMSGQILTMRSELLDWDGQLIAWNDRQLRDADESLLSQFGRLQSSLTTSLSVALGGGLLLMLASMAYILRLERQTRGRYRELAQSRYELERLSLRLVDAQEEERRSISRELHDEVGQALGALLVDLGRLSTNLPTDSLEIREQLHHMKSVAERTVGTVRDMALLLRPSMLDDLGLVAALEWQGREVSRRSQMEVAVESENVSDSLPDEYRICVYRLVQEALNNAVRHSHAHNARVRVATTENGIVVEVSDDGSGFQPDRTRGLGILGMEERVKRLGGTLTVRSSPGQGTTVRAELPLPVAAGAPA